MNYRPGSFTDRSPGRTSGPCPESRRQTPPKVPSVSRGWEPVTWGPSYRHEPIGGRGVGRPLRVPDRVGVLLVETIPSPTRDPGENQRAIHSRTTCPEARSHGTCGTTTLGHTRSRTLYRVSLSSKHQDHVPLPTHSFRGVTGLGELKYRRPTGSPDRLTRILSRRRTRSSLLYGVQGPTGPS